MVKGFHRMIAGVKDSYQMLCRKLRKIREERGLTQEEYAESAGFNYKFYQQLESGRKKFVRLDTVDRLAAGFKMETWELLKPEKTGRLLNNVHIAKKALTITH